MDDLSLDDNTDCDSPPDIIVRACDNPPVGLRNPLDVRWVNIKNFSNRPLSCPGCTNIHYIWRQLPSKRFRFGLNDETDYFCAFYQCTRCSTVYWAEGEG